MRVPPGATWFEESPEFERDYGEYPYSGLYPNDGSISPLWKVNWYAYHVEPLSDGVHLVRHGPWAQNSLSEAVTFFKNGRNLRSYEVKDLVMIPALMPHSVSHFRWRSDVKLDDANKSLFLRTKHLEFYRFDVTTGEITYSFSAVKLALVMALLIAIAAIIYRNRRSRPPSDDDFATPPVVR